MLYCRMFVEWFSRKRLDHYSYPASIAQQQSRRNSANTNGRTPTNHGTTPHTTMMTTTHSTHAGPTPARSTKAVTTCQESARPHANSKKTRPHSSTNAKHDMRSVGSAECQSTTPPKRTRATNHTILTTSTQSANTPNSSSTQQASAQATPAAIDSEATKTHQHQSEHSQDNG